jgi:hypothetical protein
MREREQKRQRREQGKENLLENGCPGKKIYGIHTIFNNEMHSIKVQASIFRVERLH